MTKFIFLLSESFRGLYRAKIPTIISSITIAISLMILSIAIFSYYNFIGFGKNIKSEFTMKVFFNQDISIEDANDLYTKIFFIDGIDQGEFIDKEKASSIFTKYFNEDVEDMVGENPLPMGANYTILEDFRNLRQAKIIQAEIEKNHGIDEVIFERETIEKINNIIEIILSIGFFIGIFILWISVILVSNTITLIIYSKQKTIEILKLLGATNSFIRFPFIMEGIFQGILGSILSIIILYFLNSFQIYFLDSLVNKHMLVPSIIIPCNIAMGILLGIIGSYRALLKRV